MRLETTRTNENDANDRERRPACERFEFSSFVSFVSFPSFRCSRRSRSVPIVLLLAAIVLCSALGRAQSSESVAVVAELKQAFTDVYNLDYPEAVAHARRAITLGPDSSRAHRGLAAILWLQMLFQRGAVSIDHYLGNISKSQANLPKPDPAAAEEFKRVVGRAIDLANTRLKANPKDLQAKFDAGAAYGLQASYVASVEGSVMSAFGIAKNAFDAQEEVLDKDPSRTAAGLVVGTYRYLVSTFNLPTRMVAYIAGFGGGKEKGIQLLEAAAKDPETRVDAAAALMLIYSREGRHNDVVRIARQLAMEFPKNRLLVLEEGSAAIRAGRAAEAEAALTRGLEMFHRETRPRVPGEESLWLYKRGLARLNLNRRPAAADDLNAALAAQPTSWVRGRIHVELGKLADLGGRRAEATAAYRTAKSLCDANADALCAGEASKYLRKPFAFTGGEPIH
jgi:tetratricopeptide (TPR) repeat protein